MTLEPMLQAQLLGQDTEGCLRMARTYYRWAKQIYRKLQIDRPEELAALEQRRTPVSITIRIRVGKPGKPRPDRSAG